LNICRCRLPPLFLYFIYMIHIASKITKFSLCLFVYFFENIILLDYFVHAALKERMASTPQGLIIVTPISQYASYSTMLCLLHSNINKEQHEKHLCNPSSHYRKYGKYICDWIYGNRSKSHIGSYEIIDFKDFNTL